LYYLEGAAQAAAALAVPVLLFSGTEDAPHDPMAAFAAEQNLNFLSLPGDHNGAVMNTAAEVSQALLRFL